MLTIAFELDGQRFTALNGGPAHKFNEAVSFVVRCDYAGGNRSLLVEAHRRRQRNRLRLARATSSVSAGRSLPGNIVELLRPPKSMQAMMKMKKLDIATLEKAGRE